MQIDWLTVVAQIVNFLVLVWLLQHFLYGPITRAMERREERIASRLREAVKKCEEADREAAGYRDKQSELDVQREQLLADAREEADQKRRALERKARSDVEQKKLEWLQQVEDQREEFLRDLRQRATEQFYTLARRTLTDLADAELEGQIVRKFIEKLTALDQGIKEKIATAGSKAGDILTVRSRFEMAANLRQHVTKIIHEEILGAAEVIYEQTAETGVGLELKAGGQTVSWNLDSYLDGLESEIFKEGGDLHPASE